MRYGTASPSVATPAATVFIGGVLRDASEVSVTRELGGGGVPGASGVAAASGNVTTSQSSEPVSDGPMPSPWRRVDGWPPAPGTPADVAVGTHEAGVYSALSAVVDTASGDADGNLTLGLVDPIDVLHRQVTIPPLLAAMPPSSWGGPYRRVGLSSDYIVTRALRACGVCNTPYLPAATVGVSVPAQGSMWPERGTCLLAASYGSADFAAGFDSAPWGWGVSDARAVYTPSGTLTLAAGFEIALMCGTDHAATATVSVKFVGRTDSVNFVVSSGRLAAGNLNGATSPRPTTGGATAWRRAVLRIEGATWTTTDDLGRTDTATMTYPSGLSTAAVETVTIEATPGSVIGGIIVGNLNPGHYLGDVLELRARAVSSLNVKLLASPAIVRRDVVDLISEVANATCHVWWWDEDGTLFWEPGDTLLTRPVVTELTSLDNLEDFAWQESLADQRSRVVVQAQAPSIQRGTVPSVEVWRASGDATSAGTDELIVHPPSGEEWVSVVGFTRLADSTIPDFNAGPGSFYGGVTPSNSVPDAADLSVSLTGIDPQSWKVTTVATGAFDQKVPDQVAIRAWKRGESLPVLRAYAKVTWSDVVSTAGSGPQGAAEYVHDAGPWLQGYTGEAGPAVAAFLAAWLCTPRAKVQNVSVVHDPRVQVGDVVSVVDTHAHGVNLTALVTRIQQSSGVADQSMQLDLFVISAGTNSVSYDDLSAASSTYDALAAPVRTYDQLAASPLL